MQNCTIRFVEDLKAQIEPTGCSIHTALGVVLPAYEPARLLKLRDAALDLVRIVELEIIDRDTRAEAVGEQAGRIAAFELEGNVYDPGGPALVNCPYYDGLTQYSDDHECAGTAGENYDAARDGGIQE